MAHAVEQNFVAFLHELAYFFAEIVGFGFGNTANRGHHGNRNGRACCSGNFTDFFGSLFAVLHIEIMVAQQIFFLLVQNFFGGADVSDVLIDFHRDNLVGFVFSPIYIENMARKD